MTADAPQPDHDPTLPERLPYRLLTGTDDRAFCEKVSAALLDGYVLHGAPTITHDGAATVVAQAVVLPDHAADGLAAAGADRLAAAGADA